MSSPFGRRGRSGTEENPEAGARRIRRARRVWGVVALVALAAGVTFTVVVVRAELDSTRERERRTFAATADEVSSSLRLELQRQNDLVVSAAAFAADNPNMTTAELRRWVESVDAVERYPTLWGVTMVRVVDHDELPAYTDLVAGDPEVLPAGTPLQILPPGPRDYYCFLQAVGYQVEGSPAIPPGLDYCADPILAAIVVPSMLEGESAYQTGVEINGTMPLIVTAPVYDGGDTPDTVEDRRARYVGAMATVVDIQQLIDEAVAGRPGVSATLRYTDQYADVSFEAGRSAERAHVVTREIFPGWQLSLATETDIAAMGMTGSTLAILVTGISVPVLIVALLYVLGTGRARALHRVDIATAELRHQALHDPLTDLPNRALIVDRAEALLARCRRERSIPAAMFVDLDGFKDVNDSLGHGAGDELLRAVSARLTRVLRGTDTIGRMGGDEFVVLVDGAAIPAGPEVVADRLLEAMRQPFELGDDGRRVRITASVGIAVGDRPSADELLRDADIALYEAKAAGRACWRVLGEGADEAVRWRTFLEHDLRGLDLDDELRLVYQPIYDLDGLSVVGVEALLRWDHPDHGEISPVEFVPLLERSGQIVEVGRWVLDRACAQLAEWHRSGLEIGMSVNVSARQLEDERFADHVRTALAGWGIDAGSLTLEITETALMADPNRVAGLLQEVKALGVQIAIDDFGTGYSSLAYLKKFPVDSLKIDRVFIEALAESPDSQALVRTLVQLGRQLGLHTLAEGVETLEQIDQLRLEQVDEAQGFLLARPLSAEAVWETILGTISPRPRS